MRPTVRLGVVPSELDQILFTGKCQTPDKVDQAKGPKALAIGPLSLKLRWLVSNLNIVYTTEIMQTNSTSNSKQVLLISFPPYCLAL